MSSVADVTHGVTAHGAAPATNRETGVALELPLIATIATVPSDGFSYALTGAIVR